MGPVKPHLPANFCHKRRFEAGYRNFENLYKTAVDAWALYDNSGLEPLLLEWDEK